MPDHPCAAGNDCNFSFHGVRHAFSFPAGVDLRNGIVSKNKIPRNRSSFNPSRTSAGVKIAVNGMVPNTFALITS
jgi:hypothetical protein